MNGQTSEAADKWRCPPRPFCCQDLLKPNEAQPPISTTAALRQELKTVREEARVEIELLRKTIVEKEQESLTYRERAEKAEKSLQSVKVSHFSHKPKH